MNAVTRRRATLSLLAVTALVSACGRPLDTAPRATARTAGSTEVRMAPSAKQAPATVATEFVVASSGAQPLTTSGATVIDRFSFKGTTYTLLGAERSAVARLLDSVRRQPGVLRAEANTLAYASEHEGPLPNDEFYSYQAGLERLNLPGVWTRTRGEASMLVAVVDSGVDPTHPDLAGQVLPGKDFSFRPKGLFQRKDKNGAMDDNGHGTHVAGLIAAKANNGIGGVGVAPGVKVLPVKVAAADGSCTGFDMMKGVAYAITNGAKVVNLSLGGMVTTSVERQFFEVASQSGALLVAAAGNEATELAFPASYPGVLSVGATDTDGNLARFSNHSAAMSVTAPGVALLSTFPGGRYMKMSGTSMAAPVVSGIAALVWSAHPDWTAQQVKDQIERTATDKGAPGVDSLYGHGEVNLQAALGL